MPEEVKPDARLARTRNFFLLKQIATQPLQVQDVQGITIWEELHCVGYNPAQSRLEAVVLIHQETGYSGGLCTNGSTEFVRFFIDWGAGYEDAGLTSFRAYDIPGAPPAVRHPLHAMVYVQLRDEDHRRLCISPVLPKVKAVLSWNSVPDAVTPPVFGNSKEVYIQIKPRPWFLKDIFEVHQISLESVFVKQFDLQQPMPLAQLHAADFVQLQEEYKKLDIPTHRSLYDVAYPTVKAGAKTKLLANFKPEYFKDIDFNWEALGDFLLQTQGNTDFEQLVCVGLNADRDMLGAIIYIKKPNGYSGTLCTSGSTEYVAFWADWDNNGSYDEYLGTAQVEVHDITSMPAEGLYYCVSLPINVANRLRHCSNPNVIGIRGVLSWNMPPSTTDPNDLHYWGNRLDVQVLLRKLEVGGTGVDFHYHDIGHVPLSEISGGFAYPWPSALPDRNRPWGGGIHIGGRFGNAGAPGTVHYRVEVRNTNAAAPDGTWQPVTLSQTFYLYNPVTEVYNNVITQNTPDGWFEYLEDFTGGPVIDEYDATLASWDTGTKQGTYYIRVLYTTDHTHATYDSTLPLLLTINNIRYNENSAFHNYMSGGATLSAAHTVDMIFDNGGGCISAGVGTDFNGHFKAVHSYFAKVNLFVLPANSGAVLSSPPGVSPTPPSVTLERPVASAPSTSGFLDEQWRMSTGGMQKCGYVLVLRAFERTIYHNNHTLPYVEISIGFAII